MLIKQSLMLLLLGGLFFTIKEHRSQASANRSTAVQSRTKKVERKAVTKVIKTDEEWRRLLTPQQFYVTRKKGTERAFTGEYHNSKDKGIYHCICCGNTLFSSEQKYDSGTGWPSFYAPVEPQAVSEHQDRSWFMTRTEVRCADCDAHLGHVFPDGPRPTGLRYCMNGHAMRFEKETAGQAVAAEKDESSR